MSNVVIGIERGRVASQVNIIAHYLRSLSSDLVNFEKTDPVEIKRTIHNLKFEFDAMLEMVPDAIEEMKRNKLDNWTEEELKKFNLPFFK